jgi:hypothetical protein
MDLLLSVGYCLLKIVSRKLSWIISLHLNLSAIDICPHSVHGKQNCLSLFMAQHDFCFFVCTGWIHSCSVPIMSLDICWSDCIPHQAPHGPSKCFLQVNPTTSLLAHVYCGHTVCNCGQPVSHHSNILNYEANYSTGVFPSC